MKILLALSFLVAIGCKNPKADIVEQQKQIKSELLNLETKKVLAEYKITKIKDAALKRGTPQEIIYDPFGKITPDEKKSIDSLQEIVRKTNQIYFQLKDRFDSLEMELKKY
jgi:hypothetical protein